MKKNDLTILLYLIIFSVFSPTLVASLRLEHFILYPVAYIALIAFIRESKKKDVISTQNINILWINLLLLSIYVFVTLIVTLSNNGFSSEALGSLDSILQVMIIIFISIWFYKNNTIVNLDKLMVFFLWLLMFNTVFIIINMIIGENILSDLYRNEVAELARLMGRFTGVFNQPIESGLCYSLGLFFYVYLVQQRKLSSLYKLLFIFSIVVGGIFSVSKVFVIVGLLIGIVYYFTTLNFKKIILSSFFGLLFIVGLNNTLKYFWEGYDYFIRLFSFSEIDNPLSVYTGGRFSESGYISNVFSSVAKESFLYGKGLITHGPLDNAFLDFFYKGGFIGIVIYFLMILILISITIKTYRNDRRLGKLAGCLIILIIASQMGASVLTINYFSILFWVFFIQIYFESCRISKYNFNVSESIEEDERYEHIGVSR